MGADIYRRQQKILLFEEKEVSCLTCNGAIFYGAFYQNYYQQ
jgi:hypothetical protein